MFSCKVKIVCRLYRSNLVKEPKSIIKQTGLFGLKCFFYYILSRELVEKTIIQ